MKKFLSKEKTLLMLIIVFMLALTACSDEKETKDESKEDDKAKAEETAKVEETAQPTNEPINPNVLNLSDYKYYGKSDTEDVYVIAEFLSNGEGKAQNINYCEILNVSDDNILVVCTISTNIGVDEDGLSLFNIEHKFLLINKATMKIEKELTLEDGYNIVNRKDIFLVSSYEGSKGTIYNNQLESIGEYSIEGVEAVCVSETGENAYYVKNSLLYKYNINTKESTQISINKDCEPSSVKEVVTADGVDYITVEAVFSDTLLYVAIINAQTGEVKYVEDSYLYSYVENNVYYLCESEGEWIVALDDKTQWKFYLEDQDIQVKCMILDNGYVAYSYTEDDIVSIELFDGDTGKLIGIQKIKVPYTKVEGEVEDNEEPIPKAYMINTPQYLDENTLIISIENVDKEVRYYIWNLQSSQSEGLIKSKRYEMGENPSREVNGTNYVPRELSADLHPLKERTDKLEKKYGLEIFIGEECGRYAGGYSVNLHLNYYEVEDSIDVIESALEKYPLGFFEQFKTDYIQGVNLYLAGYMEGIDEGTVAGAGGFKTLNDSRICIYLNCSEFDNLETKFHHEVAHGIDDVIQWSDYTLLSNEEWEKLNPKTGMYTFSYNEFGYSENDMYVYVDNRDDVTVKDTYFVDFYAMTFPTEDRARIFENVMTSENLEVDFDEAPYLKAKLNYYADCIRTTFDTTGWGEVGWEAYK